MAHSLTYLPAGLLQKTFAILERSLQARAKVSMSMAGSEAEGGDTLWQVGCNDAGLGPGGGKR